MEVVHGACAGLDVHQKTVVVCARVIVGDKVVQEVKTFETTTRELLALCDWLSERGVTHVAMESTGEYWKPVWHVLEGSFELVLANAGQIKNVPGRKTDVNDATWIANLFAHGLIRASFVPPTPVQEIRDLTRTRKQLVHEIARHTQRIQKTLEDANVKLTSFISDVLGRSGRAILDALVGGETDPEKLVDLTTGRLQASRSTLVEALRGKVREHHRFLLKLHLGQVDTLQGSVCELEARIGETLRPFQERADLLTTIPGVSDIASHVIVSEIGIDMSRFPSSAHLISWAGLCPRSDESAGKRRSTRVRKGTPWLIVGFGLRSVALPIPAAQTTHWVVHHCGGNKTVLVQVAWAATRKKNSYLQAQFLRIKNRRGPMKAILAVAASILTAAYHMLRDRIPYKDLKADYFDKRDHSKIVKRLVRRLSDLGVQVEVKPAV